MFIDTFVIFRNKRNTILTNLPRKRGNTMNTIYTPEERAQKIEKCIEIVRGMSEEELEVVKDFIDNLKKEPEEDAQK